MVSAKSFRHHVRDLHVGACEFKVSCEATLRNFIPLVCWFRKFRRMIFLRRASAKLRWQSSALLPSQCQRTLPGHARRSNGLRRRARIGLWENCQGDPVYSCCAFMPDLYSLIQFVAEVDRSPRYRLIWFTSASDGSLFRFVEMSSRFLREISM